MPFDGILTNKIAKELNNTLTGGRIGKIHQIGRDAVVMQIRASGENHRLLLSCNASSARIHLTERQFENPDNPPVFCMLLRKHFAGGIIKEISTNGFERIVTIETEVIDDLGDRSIKRLIIEIMGRHSNIIILNRDNIIIDAMKHVDFEVNRVRELLPARPYVLPPAQDKLDPSLDDTLDALLKAAPQCRRKVESFLLDNLKGFSPVLCREICFRSSIDESLPANKLTFHELIRITEAIKNMMDELKSGIISPTLVFDDNTGKPVDFHCLKLLQYSSFKGFDTISGVVEEYYALKYSREFNSQKVKNLHDTVSRLLEKSEKRLTINLQTYEENKNYDEYRLFGELITANIYSLAKGMNKARVINYYSEHNEMVEIPLDKDKTPQQNAQAYFKKYNKARTAFSYAQNELSVIENEISYFESVLFAIENAESTEQLSEIRMELLEQGYIRYMEKKGRKSPPTKILPQKIISKDGFEILIGQNNKQNDKLTLKLARHEDIWLHIKDFAGSHVVIKTEGKEVPDTTIIEAAEYAAWFSKARSAPKAEVDYTRIRNVKKPSGAKPGMVIYVNYYTVIVTPREPQKSLS
ncbi:MAG: fibronectin/fibrinogen-binding protein [Clostridiaceae bacterium]|jgi:predicted ribosome quality control (RQC) complex YloA/Tae2 family protein|nr:fibronectin/fibrinogen-binding protein [Clostridiaceae bacterium]